MNPSGPTLRYKMLLNIFSQIVSPPVLHLDEDDVPLQQFARPRPDVAAQHEGPAVYVDLDITAVLCDTHSEVPTMTGRWGLFWAEGSSGVNTARWRQSSVPIVAPVGRPRASKGVCKEYRSTKHLHRLWMLSSPHRQQGVLELPGEAEAGLRTDVVPPVQQVVQVRGVKRVLAVIQRTFRLRRGKPAGQGGVV